MSLRLSPCNTVCLRERKHKCTTAQSPCGPAVRRQNTQTHAQALLFSSPRAKWVVAASFRPVTSAAAPRVVPLGPRLQTILKGREVSRAALPKPIHTVQTPRGCPCPIPLSSWLHAQPKPRKSAQPHPVNLRNTLEHPHFLTETRPQQCKRL